VNLWQRIFGPGRLNTRISEIEKRLASASDLAISINAAVDRIDEQLTCVWSALECVDCDVTRIGELAGTATADIEAINDKVDENIVLLDARISALHGAFGELDAAHDANVRFIAGRLGLKVKDDAAPVPPVAEPVVECVDELADAEISARAEQLERFHARRERRRRARAASAAAA
jgi:hypothetical protein